MSVSEPAILRLASILAAILLLCQACAGSSIRTESGASSSRPRVQWNDLLRRIEAEGEHINYSPLLARDLDLPPNCPIQVLLSNEQAVDGLDRDVSLVLPKPGKPSAVMFQTVRSGAKSDWIVRYLVSLDGSRLQKAVALEGTNDRQGRPIRGSARRFPKDINSREVRKGYQRELDFWLKGMYRKPSARPSSSATK